MDEDSVEAFIFGTCVLMMIAVGAYFLANQEEAERPAPSRAECVQEGAA